MREAMRRNRAKRAPAGVSEGVSPARVKVFHQSAWKCFTSPTGDEATARVTKRNSRNTMIRRQFSPANARIKLQHLYQKI
jgi:hypothetical protein